MSLSELHRDLKDKQERPDTFRDYLRGLRESDRSLFFKLARNRPGPGAPVQNPKNKGFLVISEADADATRESVRDAPYYDKDREQMFQDIIAIVHRHAPNFRIYIGRTFVRTGEEHRGPKQRWTNHQEEKSMKYAKVLARVPRDRIEADEALAIALVKVWEGYDVLCCNNNVIGGGPTTNDDQQAIYMCLAPKQNTGRRDPAPRGDARAHLEPSLASPAAGRGGGAAAAPGAELAGVRAVTLSGTRAALAFGGVFLLGLLLGVVWDPLHRTRAPVAARINTVATTQTAAPSSAPSTTPSSNPARVPVESAGAVTPVP